MTEKMPPGLASRAAVSIVVGIAWLVFLVIFFAFYADRFSVYQNLAIFIASILVVGAIMIPMWVYWGIKVAPKYAERWESESTRRRRKR
jgi:membrane protease YdiL (CAAX protease family)